MLHFDSIHPIVTRGSRVSRPPPHHTLPDFLNLNGISLFIEENFSWIENMATIWVFATTFDILFWRFTVFQKWKYMQLLLYLY